MTLARWSPSEFLKLYNPDNQSVFASKYHDRCMVGNAPTLCVMEDAYGYNFTKAWIMLQLIKVNKNVLGSDTKKKMTPEQIEVCAETIMTTYKFLKCTDLMLFFTRFMSGKHGSLYGCVDMIVLTKGLDEYCEWRLEQIARIQKEEDRKRSQWIHEQWDNEKRMTREEWENSFEYQKLRMTMTDDEVRKIDNFTKKLL